MPDLTPRERDVLSLAAQGKPNKLICRELDIGMGTVKSHLLPAYRKLGVHNRTQAALAWHRLN